MRVFSTSVVIVLFATGCATGTSATGDDDDQVDSGKGDSSVPRNDSSAPKDSSTPKDSTTTQPDTSSNNCGGSCLGDNTCCDNTCVDITSDQNNCGGCSSPCGTQTCCSSSCVDTMGSDDSNCGGCGIPCSGTCTAGVCVTGACTNDIGSCSHSPCVTGVALTEGCDPDEDTLFECEFLDPTCCTSSWSASCVSDIVSELGEDCSGC